MMRRVLLIIVMIFVALFTIFYVQYSKEINNAYQRVHAGSNKLVTEKGEIEYSIEGEGHPILLIHGAGGGYDQGLLAGKTFLGNGYKFISISRFGYLGSPFVGDSTVEEQAFLYASFLDELGIDKIIILGFSAGGPSALQFAHDFPDRSHALILVSAVSKFMGDDVPVSTKIVNTIQKSDFAYWLALKLFRPQFLELIGVPKETYESLDFEGKDFTNKMLEVMNPMSPRLPGTLHEAKIKPLSKVAMGEITVPTIIFHAKDDGLVPYEQGELSHENIDNSQFVSFDSGGHIMASERELIKEHIIKFLYKKIKE